MATGPNRLQLVLAGLAAVAVAAAVGYWLLLPRMTQTAADLLGQGEYSLTGTDGTAFTEKTLRGAPSAVFFGFTHCPDVCPTTLGEIMDWQDEMSKVGDTLRFYFVSVDPDRDTLAVLRDYVSWVPGVTGVTGTPEETAKAIRAFRVYARKVPLDDGDYTMDHSAMVMLFDRKGRFFEPISYQEDPARALAKIKSLLAR